MNENHKLKRAYQAILNSDFEEAAFWFEKAIESDPDNADYHYRLSITYSRSNKLNKALEHAETAARLDPDKELYQLHVELLHAKELVVRAEKSLEGRTAQPLLAIALLKQAVSLDPLSVEAYLLLGVSSASAGDYAQAVQALREALRLDPEQESALSLLPVYERKLKKLLGTDQP